MRIGFDAKRLFNNFTGLGNYSRFVVKALAENYPQHSYSLYTPKLKQHKESAEFVNNPAYHIHTPSRWVKGSGFGSFWRSVNLGNVAFRDGIELFHGLSNELPLTKPGGLKTVVTIHDLIFKRYPEFYKTIDVKIYSRKVAKACESADRIIAISQQTAADLKEFMNADASKIRVVYQGCHAQFHQRKDTQQLEAVRAKYNLPADFLLSVGTLENRKNAMLILKALTHLEKPVPLVLVGKSTAYQNILDEFIQQHKLLAQVHFIHHVDFADLPAIYQQASVFIYPSRFEGFGIPIIESIASGVPVIAATGSCLQEAGGPASLYVNPDDEIALAEKITTLRTNTTQRGQIITQSREFIKQFEPQPVAAATMKVYTELMQG